MCDGCWDADKRKEKMLSNQECDGIIKPSMTLNQLKTHLFQEWLETGKTHFRIYREALFDPPSTNFTWSAVKVGKNDWPEKESRITVSLI